MGSFRCRFAVALALAYLASVPGRGATGRSEMFPSAPPPTGQLSSPVVGGTPLLPRLTPRPPAGSDAKILRRARLPRSPPWPSSYRIANALHPDAAWQSHRGEHFEVYSRPIRLGYAEVRAEAAGRRCGETPSAGQPEKSPAAKPLSIRPPCPAPAGSLRLPGSHPVAGLDRQQAGRPSSLPPSGGLEDGHLIKRSCWLPAT